MATETSSAATSNGYAGRFGGTVETVLSSPRIAPPPATLEEARNQPGRRERIQELVKRIESEGVKYVFFQQVSVTGRVMGKGVVASFFPQVAEKGYQLVYGATANLFTDRHGNYIGFGPEESELAAVADLDTFAVLPWDNRVARVYCDCYDTETGELLDADPRQNLKRIAHEFEEELGLQFLIGIEPEMMWLKKPEPGQVPEGVFDSVQAKIDSDVRVDFDKIKRLTAEMPLDEMVRNFEARIKSPDYIPRSLLIDQNAHDSDEASDD